MMLYTPFGVLRRQRYRVQFITALAVGHVTLLSNFHRHSARRWTDGRLGDLRADGC
jgi:hypothetical protein